jgi:hypothetical protein
MKGARPACCRQGDELKRLTLFASLYFICLIMLCTSGTALKKLLYIPIILNLILTPFYAQPSITWQKSYVAPVFPHENFGDDICMADNNNIFIIGTTNTNLKKAYIIKINPYGDTIWTRLIDSLDAIAAVSSGDGGCVFTGNYTTYPDYSYTLKVNSNGNIVWFKTYPPLGLIRCSRIIKTTDNGYITCGYRAYYEGYILKIDSNGNYQWDRSYPAGYAKFYAGICEAFNGGYMAVGKVSDIQAGAAEGVISRIDNFGNIEWEKRFDIDFNTIHVLTNGYIIGGSWWDLAVSNSRACFVKINMNGDTLFKKVFGGDADKLIILEDLRIINNNKYVFTEERFHPNLDVSSRTYITDSLGNIIKFRIFDETTLIDLSRILPLVNNDIMFVGSANYVNEIFLNAHVIRADSNLYAPPIGINETNSKIPSSFKLYQNYPNPFNPTTKINFSIPPSRGARGVITRLIIYDILGREIAVLVNNKLNPGTYEAEFDGSNYPSGVYFYRLSAGEYTESKKMVLIK